MPSPGAQKSHFSVSVGVRAGMVRGAHDITD